MSHEYANSESLQSLVAQIEARRPSLLLPEFQRDFVWQLSQTYTLIDSLIRNIFIGAVIYGKPSFEMTLRRIDHRPRTGPGSRERVERLAYDQAKIRKASQVDDLKILLDGQQRVTSIYRALRGIDKVYFVARDDLPSLEVRKHPLKALMHPEHGIQGEDQPDCVCVPIHYAFQYTLETPFDEDVLAYFRTQTRYGRTLVEEGREAEERAAFRAFRQLLPRFKTLFEEPRILSFFLLDMDLDEFATFFERSNSMGTHLSFTDILAAKVFSKFDLRAHFDALGDEHPGLPTKRDLLVRAVAVKSGRFQRIEKGEILRELRAEDFVGGWEDIARLYVRALDYLHAQRLMVSTRWLPSDNLLIPLMMFFDALGTRAISQAQQDFLRWWYWGATFSEHYSSASNERVVADVRVLQRVARGEPIEPSFFVRLRPLVDDPEQLFTFKSATSVTYKGILNLVHYASGGLKDWSNDGPLATTTYGGTELHDHHFFPQGYLRRSAAQQDRPGDVDHLRDSVVNRVLMPKSTNLRAADKAPHVYLQGLKLQNPNLERSLASHLISPDLLHDEAASTQVYRVLWERAEAILRLIRRETVELEPQMRALHTLERQPAVS